MVVVSTVASQREGLGANPPEPTRAFPSGICMFSHDCVSVLACITGWRPLQREPCLYDSWDRLLHPHDPEKHGWIFQLQRMYFFFPLNSF